MHKYAVLAATMIVVIVGAMSGAWVWINLPTQTSNTEEIREYNGQILSSIRDFRNEAIEGNRDVNISTSTLTIMGLVHNETVLTYDEVVS